MHIDTRCNVSQCAATASQPAQACVVAGLRYRVCTMTQDTNGAAGSASENEGMDRMQEGEAGRVRWDIPSLMSTSDADAYYR